jgi:OmpA-OmpF porin, OOP family
MSQRILVAGVALAAMFLAVPAEGQSMLDRAKAKAKERVDKAADKATDKAMDKAESKVKCAVTDQACIDRAAAEGKEVETTGAATQAGATAGAAAGPAAGGRPGAGAWANFDFVPGERVIFAEDFTRDRVGNFPRRFELHKGNGEVVEWNGGRWLRFTANSNDDGFHIQLPEVLPQRFTIEFDLTIPWMGMDIFAGDASEGSYKHGRIHFSGSTVGLKRANSSEGSTVDPRAHFPDMFADDSYISRPFRIRIHADGRYVKLYIEEKRIGNLPNLDFARSDKLTFEYNRTTVNNSVHPPMIANISINAGGKDMYDALIADGRVAVQGIYFDTGSDRIRPESSGTLKEIADMLAQHSDLKLVIEGHTDNVGDASANQTLSEKRAAAVAAALSGTYKVDAGRLTSKGFGASKPAASNDSPEGRQQNRRVELVRG